MMSRPPLHAFLLIALLLLVGGCTTNLPIFGQVTLMTLPEFKEYLEQNNLSKAQIALSNFDQEDADVAYMRAVIILLEADQSKNLDSKKATFAESVFYLEKSVRLGSPSALALKGFLVRKMPHLVPDANLKNIWLEYVELVESKRYKSRLIPLKIINSLNGPF